MLSNRQILLCRAYYINDFFALSISGFHIYLVQERHAKVLIAFLS